MTSNMILWAATAIMLAGGFAILAIGKRRTPAEEMQTVLHGVVPIIAACSYLAMATGQGLVSLPTVAAAAAGQPGPTRIFYYARYIDWTFTTPLLLLSLGLGAMRRGPKLYGALTGAILADLVMIVTAFAFGASLHDPAKWTWFIVSCAAFLGVYYVIWKPQMDASAGQRDDVRSTYRRDAALLSVVWLAYPVVLAVAPDGLGVIGDAAGVGAIAVLDVVAKVVFGLMSVRSDTRATDRDLAEGETATDRPLRRAA